MDQVHAVRDRIAELVLNPRQGFFDHVQMQPSRAEDAEKPATAHRLDDLDRADSIGHRTRHAGVAQPVIGDEARVPQIFQPARRNVRGHLVRSRRTRTDCRLFHNLKAARPIHDEKRVADPSQRALQILRVSRGHSHGVAPHLFSQSIQHGSTFDVFVQRALRSIGLSLASIMETVAMKSRSIRQTLPSVGISVSRIKDPSCFLYWSEAGR